MLNNLQVNFFKENGYLVINNLLMPLWLQTQVGYTATWAGLVAAPTGVVAVLLTPGAAKLLGKYDARIIASLAFVAFGVSYLMRSNYTNQASFQDPDTKLKQEDPFSNTIYVAYATDNKPFQNAPSNFNPNTVRLSRNPTSL